MNICHVITRLILGGAQENTILTCEGLHQAGHNVTLVTGPALGPEGELLTRARNGGYEVIVTDDLRREINPLRDWRSLKKLRAILAARKPDVMHSHSSKAGILARQAAWDLATPLVVHTIHGLPFHPYQPWWLNRLYIMLERRCARQSGAIISVADAMTAKALAAGIGSPAQYVTIRSGMETESFLNRPPQADEFRRGLNLPDGAVLFSQVSRIAPLKGHDFILSAAAQVPNNIHFCFVGDGPISAQVARRVDELGLSGRVHMTGLLPPDMMPAVMHASDVVIHCSLREGLARAIPQAMLAARPVASFDIDGAREVVTDETGILLPGGDVPALVSAIVRLGTDESLRNRLGRAGRDLCRDLFDWRVMVRQIEDLYSRLLNQPAD